MINQKKYLFISSLILLLICFLGYQFYSNRTQVSEFDLSASVSNVYGISPESSFLLKSTASLSAKVIEKYIEISPAIGFDIKEVNAAENTFEIVPKENLETNQIYTIKIDEGPLSDRTLSWAYQVRAPFQLISSIPSDKSNYVPTNTIFEFSFNRSDIIDPEKHIKFNPDIKGRFESKDEKLVFIPNNPLDYEKVYEIKIDSSLKSKISDESLVEDIDIKFETDARQKDNEYFYLNGGKTFYEFRNNTDIFFGLNTNSSSNLNGDLYRLNSAQDFIEKAQAVRDDEYNWSAYSKNNFEKHLTGNQKIISWSFKTENDKFSLPERLETGYYALVVSLGDKKDIVWFQVNPVASFSASSNSKTLIWLKDIESQQSLTNVPIIYDGNEINRTGNDGVALFDIPSSAIEEDENYSYTTNGFIVAKPATGDLVIPMRSEYGGNLYASESDRWWDYISINKGVYLPTDTIYFWSIQKNRDANFGSEEITVRLTDNSWRYSEDVKTYAETNIANSEFGTVTGELSFENLKPGYYSLGFFKGDDFISQETINVSSYIKPAYSISLTPDKNVTFAGEPIKIKVEANFFDGTPVSDLNVKYDFYDNGSRKEGSLSLNRDGSGTFEVLPEYSQDTSDYYYNSWPKNISVSVRPVSSEEGEIYSNISVLVFGPKVFTSVDKNQAGSDVTFKLETKKINLDDGKTNEPYWYMDKYLGGPAVGARTKVDVQEVVDVFTQVGTGYDEINKTTYPKYSHETKYIDISTEYLNSDQQGLATFNFKSQVNKNYKILFTTYDDLGRTDKNTYYVWGDNNYDYRFNNYNDDSSYGLYNLDDDKEYKIGEQFNLELRSFSGVVPPDKENNYLFMIVDNGDLEYYIQNSPKFNSTFRDKDIPNVGVWSGWFATDRFYNSYNQNISFDAEEKRLKIEVNSDKAVYKPADDISLNIKVTDKDNNPVKAEVNISALDQAVFSIKPTEKDVISTLYRDIYSSLSIRVSNKPPYGGGGAEKGGGGDDAVTRVDIEEMAIFKTVYTDGKGLANIKFKLPDNITSWRLTTHAISKDLSAGKNISLVPVTLPLFVDTTINNQYLSGDNLIMRLRTFGDNLINKKIDYVVESQTLPFGRIDKNNGTETYVDIGTLPTGEHQISSTASNDTFSDKLIKTLNVKDSYFTKNTSEFFEAVNGLKINNDAVGYTTLNFYPRKLANIYDNLIKINYQWWGIRLDQVGARLIASQSLKDNFGRHFDLPEYAYSKYQKYDGGVSLLPYSDSDLELSAMVANLFDGTVFNMESLKRYLNSSLSDEKADTSRIVRALFGLASFKEPVLVKIQNIKDDRNLTIEDKIFVALALDVIGSKEEARQYYFDNIRTKITDKKGYSYINGLDEDKTILATTLLAALTESLDEPIADNFALYFNQKNTSTTLNNFERLLYIKKAMENSSFEEAQFDYSINSNKKTIKIKPGEQFSVRLSPEELKTFQLSDVVGDLGISADFEEKTNPQSLARDNNISISRVYKVNGVATNDFKDGDDVTVELNLDFGPNALGGYYQVVDYLPSGLRAVEKNSSRCIYNSLYDECYSYPVEINNQRVTFLASNNRKKITYQARVVSRGTYKAEPAILQYTKNFDVLNISNENSIEIR